MLPSHKMLSSILTPSLETLWLNFACIPCFSLSSENHEIKQKLCLFVDIQHRQWKFTVLVLRIICVHRFTHYLSSHTCHVIKISSTLLPICTASTGAKQCPNIVLQFLDGVQICIYMSVTSIKLCVNNVTFTLTQHVSNYLPYQQISLTFHSRFCNITLTQPTQTQDSP
jgi:hypothetical protein